MQIEPVTKIGNKMTTTKREHRDSTGRYQQLSPDDIPGWPEIVGLGFVLAIVGYLLVWMLFSL